MYSLFPAPLWHRCDKALPMEGKILRRIFRTNSSTFSAILEFRVPSRCHFPFMRQMIWIIGPAACFHIRVVAEVFLQYLWSWSWCSVFFFFKCSWLHLLSSEGVAWRAPEPPCPIRAPGIARWWLTARRIYLQGSSGPLAVRKTSVCLSDHILQISSFWALGGKREHTVGFVRKSSTLTVSLEASLFGALILICCKVDGIW